MTSTSSRTRSTSSSEVERRLGRGYAPEALQRVDGGERNAPPPGTWAVKDPPQRGDRCFSAAPSGAGIVRDILTGGGAFALATGYLLERLRRKP
jgi:hypothetical protein